MSTVNTDVKELTPSRKSVTVSLSADEVAEQEAKLVKDFQRQARIPGFRPGKAPEKMVRAKYAKELRDELKQRIISSAHQEGLADADFKVFGVVELDQGEIRPGREAKIVFTVDIVPEFELPEYKGIQVTRSDTEATEQEVDQMLDQILSQRAEYNPVEKAAEKGDYVRCGYEGKIGDDRIADLAPDATIYGTQKTTWEEAGAEDAPGVRAVIDGVVGMKAGDEKEVTMDFPEDFKPEALAGKTATYQIKVEEVREKKMPEMNEELFKSLQVKDESELRERIKENIENRKKQENANAERQEITDYLLKNCEFPVPASGIEQETESVLRDFMQRNMQQGVSPEEFEKHKEQLHESASKAAHDRLKSRLILVKIAEAEKIEVENEDFSRIIMHEAMQTGQKPDKLVKELRKDQDRINRMRRDILLGKTMDLLVEQAERQGGAEVEAPEVVER
ncbi:MAG: trigger factor [Verrucomicrobiota bacterium]